MYKGNIIKEGEVTGQPLSSQEPAAAAAAGSLGSSHRQPTNQPINHKYCIFLGKALWSLPPIPLGGWPAAVAGKRISDGGWVSDIIISFNYLFLLLFILVANNYSGYPILV